LRKEGKKVRKRRDGIGKGAGMNLKKKNREEQT
jgi:hypothetical protein